MQFIQRFAWQLSLILLVVGLLTACTLPPGPTPAPGGTEPPAQTQPLTQTQTMTITQPLTQTDSVSPTGGFSLATATPAGASADAPVGVTDVPYVQALANVNLRNGPGTNFEIIGQIFAGQTAQVTGASSDGQWWRVICPDNRVGDCFVAADPALTQPTDGPGDAPVSAPVQESDQAIVEELTVQVMESFPVQVNAVLRGFLPDSCTVIESYDQVQEGPTIRLRLTTSRPADAMCLTVLTPFEQIIPLNVMGLPAGEYDVRINELVVPFSLAVANEAALPPVLGADVAFVMAQNDVPIHAGPGAEHPVIGAVAGGMIAKVTGVSEDGAWWRVICPDDSEGNCWVSADPTQTQPTTPP